MITSTTKQRYRTSVCQLYSERFFKFPTNHDKFAYIWQLQLKFGVKYVEAKLGETVSLFFASFQAVLLCTSWLVTAANQFTLNNIEIGKHTQSACTTEICLCARDIIQVLQVKSTVNCRPYKTCGWSSARQCVLRACWRKHQSSRSCVFAWTCCCEKVNFLLKELDLR